MSSRSRYLSLLVAVCALNTRETHFESLLKSIKVCVTSTCISEHLKLNSGQTLLHQGLGAVPDMRFFEQRGEEDGGLPCASEAGDSSMEDLPDQDASMVGCLHEVHATLGGAKGGTTLLESGPDPSAQPLQSTEQEADPNLMQGLSETHVDAVQDQTLPVERRHLRMQRRTQQPVTPTSHSSVLYSSASDVGNGLAPPSTPEVLATPPSPGQSVFGSGTQVRACSIQRYMLLSKNVRVRMHWHMSPDMSQ